MKKKILMILSFIFTLAFIAGFAPANAASAGCIHRDSALEFQGYLSSAEAPKDCTESAIASYLCTDCDKTIYKTTYGEHDWKEGTTIPATCTENAQAGRICSVCEEEELVEVTGTKLGHDYVPGQVDATCADPAGMKYDCSRCDAFYVEAWGKDSPLYEAAYGHNWETVEVVPANCKEKGYTLQECKNEGCGQTQKINETAVNPTAHVAKEVEILKPATCYEAGIGEYVCAKCDADLGYKSIVVEHTWEVSYDPENEDHKAPTCGEDGFGNRKCKVAECGKEEKNVVIPATGDHEITKDKYIDATCTENQKIVDACENCDYQENVREVQGSKTGHSLTDSAVGATCEKGAGVEITCENCDYYSFTAFDTNSELYAPATGHKYEVKKVVAATCTEKGYTLEVCANCEGERKTNYTAINPNGHVAGEPTEILQDGTCAKPGIGRFECTLCEADMGYMALIIEHTWVYSVDAEDEDHKAATCGKDGFGDRTCSVCGKEETDKVIPATEEHDWVEETTIPATCTTNEKFGTVCSVCGAQKDMIEVEGSKKGHSFTSVAKEATCEKAAGILTTCENEGCKYELYVEFEAGSEFYKAALGHDWKSGTVVKPTCVAKGYTPQTCQRSGCGETRKINETAINPNGHKAVEVEVLKVPACDAPGIGRFSCAYCEADLGYMATTKDHTWVYNFTEDEDYKDSTCSEAGLASRTCSVCGKYEKDVVVAKKSHSYVANTTIAATCTTPARVGKVCSVCGAESGMKNVTGSKALGHAYVSKAAPASCDKAAGVLTTCSRCDYEAYDEFEEGTEFYQAALGHKWDVAKVVKPTCVAEGYTLLTCKNSGCEEELKSDVTAIDPAGHAEKLVGKPLKDATCKTPGIGEFVCELCEEELGYMAIVVEHTWVYDYSTSLNKNYKKATCTKDGLAQRTCSVCSTKQTSVVVPATGHNYDTVKTEVAATCTENAKMAFKCLNNCGAYTKAEDIKNSALGHDLLSEVKAATCGRNAGVLTTCQRKGCKYESFVAFEEGSEFYEEALVHEYEVVEVVAPTCKKAGYTLEVCKNCADEEKTNPTEIDPNGHKPVLKTTLKDATCKNPGIGSFSCEYCKADLGYMAIIVEHDWVYDYTSDKSFKEATCTKDGLANRTCSVCSTKETKVVVPATGHDYAEETSTVAATCTENAKVAYVCENGCGSYIKAEEVKDSALGHDTTSAVKAATCGRAAGVLTTCKRSGCKYEVFVAFEEDSELYSPALEHDFEVAKVVAPTCKAKGYTLEKCNNCGKEQKTNETEIDPNAHNATLVGDPLKVGDCKTPGIGEFKCSLCKAELGYMAIVIEHTWEYNYSTALNKNYKQATCTKDGLAQRTCLVCETVQKSVVVPATGHNYSTEIGVVDATCTENQKLAYKCLNGCGAYTGAQEILETALGHDTQSDVKAATCGRDAGVLTTCKRSGCKYSSFVAFEEDSEFYEAALVHEYEVEKVVAPTCKAKGYTLEVCKNCGDEEKTNETAIDPNAHKAEQVGAALREGTCYAPGIGEFKCSLCKAELGYMAIIVEHAWVYDYTSKEELKEATCTEDGLANRTCAVELCGKVENNVVIPATGHNYSEELGIIDATCTENQKLGYKCLNECGGYVEYQDMADTALGHALVAEAVGATCTEAAGILSECARCDFKSFAAFEEGTELYEPAKGHNWAEPVEVKATCANEGHTLVACEDCDVAVKLNVTEKDPNNHVAKLVETVKAPTCTEVGIGKYECKDCKVDLGYMAIECGHTFNEVPYANEDGTVVYNACKVEDCKGIKVVAYFGINKVEVGAEFDSLEQFEEMEELLGAFLVSDITVTSEETEEGVVLTIAFAEDHDLSVYDKVWFVINGEKLEANVLGEFKLVVTDGTSEFKVVARASVAGATSADRVINYTVPAEDAE